MKNSTLHSSVAIATAALLITPPHLSAAVIEVFAKGVDPTNHSSYNNVQQTGPTCWAASGSNVIGHWQQYHVTPPENTPISADDVYNTYLSIYQSYAGGKSYTLYRWWLGHHAAASLGGYYPVEPNFSTYGGYYEDIYTSMDAVQEIAWSFVSEFGSPASDESRNTNFSRAIYYALSQGYSMAINIPNDDHAITLYGATFDTDTNLLTSVYVCDSSGASFDEKDISRVRVGLRTDTNGTEQLCLVGYYSEENDFANYDSERYLYDVYFLGNSVTDTKNFVLSIPEPSAFGALAGIGALALVAARRRRR